MYSSIKTMCFQIIIVNKVFYGSDLCLMIYGFYH